jgi:outer membrane lipoprotein carrier protein
MMKILPVGLCLLIALPGLAQDADSAAGRLVELLSGLETMRAEVEQLTLDQDGREVQEASATLMMHRPDRFYWHTIAPYEEIMTTDGESIWIYEPDLEQVTVQEFSEDVSRTPALLLSEDEESLRESFDITASDTGGGRTRFTLVPRDPGSLFETLSMTFAGKVLEEMQFSDSLGQRTSLGFSDVEVNVPVDEELFSFEPPPGVEVIDSREG